MMKQILVSLVFLFSSLALPAHSQVKAVVGGTLIHPEKSIVIEDSVILIEGDRILEVGKESDALRIPEGAEVIDAEGKWIIPGLIDSHVHFFLSGGLYTRPDILDLRKYRAPEEELSWVRRHLPETFARYIRSGVTSVVDMGGPIDNFKVRELAAKTGKAPRVSAAGPLLSTYLPEELDIEPRSIIEVDSPGEARAEVRRQARWNPDFIKIWFIVRPGSQPEDAIGWVKAAIEEGHRFGFRAAVHATGLETAKAAVEAGADILVHSVQDRAVDREFIDLLKRNEVIYIPTLMVNERYEQVFSQRIELTEAERKTVDPHIVSTLDDLKEIPPSEIPPRIATRMKAGRSVVPDPIPLENLKRLQDAGVAIALGTDAGNIGTPHGPAIFREMELMEQAGLSAAQILTAATVNGAKVMGREEELGRIEAGMLADLVILNSDPLSDIRNTSDISMVIKGGEAHKADRILGKTPPNDSEQCR